MDEEERAVIDFGVRQIEAMLASQEANVESVRRQGGTLLSVAALQAALLGTMIGEDVSVGEQVAAALLLLGFVALLVLCVSLWRPRQGFRWQTSVKDIRTIREDLQGHEEVNVWMSAIASMENWHDANEKDHLKPMRRTLVGGYGALGVQTVAVLVAAAF